VNTVAGVWHAGFGRQSLGEARRFARAVETAGFASLWFGESSRSREPLTFAGELLGATSSLQVGTGIASIWARDAVAARAAA
jgi:alkanesulfonate monooxygenase SsuD/methylene tetrahydromethanopterin reductase-like flavin-dependent oxidoreductase (luciferase family)